MAEETLADLSALYRSRFSPTEQDARKRIWEALCEEFFSRYVQPTDIVLDLACGYGEFINAIRCKQRLAFDLNPDVRAYLRPDVQFFLRSCEDLSGVADGSVDVVFESNLLEHLPNKAVLTRVTHEVSRVLRGGGRFILMQPNIKYVGSDYWDFYDHLIPLSHLSCAELLKNCGLQLETVIPRFIPYTTKSRMPKHPFFVRWYLRCPPLWRILGKQFVIVARKPDAPRAPARK
ncbi:MAG: class I SAM-dependent methyltransferase [Candidatus Binatia bacterium]